MQKFFIRDMRSETRSGVYEGNHPRAAVDAFFKTECSPISGRPLNGLSDYAKELAEQEADEQGFAEDDTDGWADWTFERTEEVEKKELEHLEISSAGEMVRQWLDVNRDYLDVCANELDLRCHGFGKVEMADHGDISILALDEGESGSIIGIVRLRDATLLVT